MTAAVIAGPRPVDAMLCPAWCTDDDVEHDWYGREEGPRA